MKSIIKFVVPAFFILFAITLNACKKDKTCYGTVKVLDASGAVVAGATVLLDVPKGQVTHTATTDGGGEAKFEIPLPAIWNVTATAASLPGKTGKGTLRADEPGKKSGTTVRML